MARRKCKKCNGEGLVKKENTITINIPKGCKNGQTVIVNGGGCESKSTAAPSGDLQVILIHQYDKNKYLVQGKTIYEKIDVPYYDAILGKEMKLTTPNGKTINFTLKPCTQDEDNVYRDTINGYEYRYIINVTMPSNINKEERKSLEKIRKEGKINKSNQADLQIRFDNAYNFTPETLKRYLNVASVTIIDDKSLHNQFDIKCACTKLVRCERC